MGFWVLLSFVLCGYIGGALRPHNHTGPSDGGLLTGLSVTGGETVTGGLTVDSISYSGSSAITQSSTTINGSLVVQTTFTLSGLASDPSPLNAGMAWYNSTVNRIKYYNGTSTIQLDPAFYVVHVRANLASAGTSQFMNISGDCVENVTGLTTTAMCLSTTELPVRSLLGVATLVRFSCSDTNAGGATTITWTVDKNGAATSMTCNSAASFKTCSTNANQVSIAAGDDIDMAFSESGGTPSTADFIDCSIVYQMGAN